jgi:hypothetical protein
MPSSGVACLWTNVETVYEFLFWLEDGSSSFDKKGLDLLITGSFWNIFLHAATSILFIYSLSLDLYLLSSSPSLGAGSRSASSKQDLLSVEYPSNLSCPGDARGFCSSAPKSEFMQLVRSEWHAGPMYLFLVGRR